MSPNGDAWETEDLVPLSNGVITVLDSYFEKGRFSTQLVWVCRVDQSIDPPEFPGENFTAWFSVGKDWLVLENGTQIVKPGQDPTRIYKVHSNSNYGRLINRVTKDLGQKDLLASRGLPTQSIVWKGLTMQVLGETIHYDDLPAFSDQAGAVSADGQPQTRSVDKTIILPTAILAIDGVPIANIASPVVVVSQVPVAAVSDPAVMPTPTIPASSVVSAAPVVLSASEVQLIQVVVGKSNLIEAKAAAMRDTTIASNDALASQILEGHLLEQWLEKGILRDEGGRLASAYA